MTEKLALFLAGIIIFIPLSSVSQESTYERYSPSEWKSITDSLSATIVTLSPERVRVIKKNAKNHLQKVKEQFSVSDGFRYDPDSIRQLNNITIKRFCETTSIDYPSYMKKLGMNERIRKLYLSSPLRNEIKEYRIYQKEVLNSFESISNQEYHESLRDTTSLEAWMMRMYIFKESATTKETQGVLKVALEEKIKPITWVDNILIPNIDNDSTQVNVGIVLRIKPSKIENYEVQSIYDLVSIDVRGKYINVEYELAYSNTYGQIIDQVLAEMSLEDFKKK